MTLQVGDTAPDFSLRDGTGRAEISLASFPGQPVVLAFYPLAFTGGCTREMQGFVEAQRGIAAANAQVVGVSVDSFAAANAFAESLGAEFPLLGDWPLNSTARAYGVYDEERHIARRVTFVIGADRTIHAVIDESKDMERHSKDALEAVQALSV